MLFPLLLLVGAISACDPTFEELLLHKCDSLPYRTISNTFSCVASTPVNYDCNKLAYNSGQATRILTSDSRAVQYINQGFWSDTQSQICRIQWNGDCDGLPVQENTCYKVVTAAASWTDAVADCNSRRMNLFTPHNDDDLQRLWTHVVDYPDYDFWIGAATIGPQWTFNDNKTVNFFRLFPATFDKLNATNEGNNSSGGSVDWFDDGIPPQPDYSFLWPSVRRRRQIDSWPGDTWTCDQGDGDLWPQDRDNCTTDGAQLALIFHSKSKTHNYLGYESVQIASEKYPYVCVKPSFLYVPGSVSPPATSPPIETTTPIDWWPE